MPRRRHDPIPDTATRRRDVPRLPPTLSNSAVPKGRVPKGHVPRRHVSCGHGNGRFKAETAAKHCKPPKDDLLHGGQGVIAPVEHGTQCLMASARGATSRGQHREGIVKPLGETTQSEESDACGGQLDRQGNAIEPTADLDDHRHVGVRQDEGLKTGDRPLDEQINRWKRQRVSRRQNRRFLGNPQRRQAADKFARGAQRLAAGCQDMHPGALPRTALASTATASIRCSQLSSTSNVCRSRR